MLIASVGPIVVSENTKYFVDDEVLISLEHFWQFFTNCIVIL